MTHPTRLSLILPGLLFMGGCWEPPIDTTSGTPTPSLGATPTPTPTPETPTPITPTPETCFDLEDQDGDGIDACELSSAASFVEGEFGDELGRIASVGDLDNDGFMDIAIGAEEESDGVLSESGVVRIYKGRPSPYDLSNPSVLIYGTFEEGYAGRPAAGGDINNDGVADLLIGARREEGEAGTGTGRVHLLCGASGGFSGGVLSLNSTSTDATFSAGDEVEALGFAMAGGGDIDGDGIDDIAIAAYANDGSNGSVHIILGAEQWCTEHINRELPGDGDITITSSDTDIQPGASLAFVEDLDADGRDELLIGAPGVPGASIPGRAYLVFGGENFDTGKKIDLGDVSGEDVISLSNGISGQRFGFAVDASGDVNGDGSADLIIGAPGLMNTEDISKGGVYIVTNLSRPSGLSTVSLPSQGNPFLPGLNTSDNLGAQVQIIPDVDDDDKDDILVGAPGLNGQGGAYLHRPFASLEAGAIPVEFRGEEGPGGLGASVVGIDTDGPDAPAPTFVLVGGLRSGTNQGGAAYLYVPSMGGEPPQDGMSN